MPSSMIARGTAVVVLSGMAALGASVPASAAPAAKPGKNCPAGKHYKPGAGCRGNNVHLQVRDRLQPGQAADVRVSGFKVGTAVDIFFNGTYLKTVRSPKGTVINTTITVPKGTSPGQHTVTASGTSQNGSPTSETRKVQVTRQKTKASSISAAKVANEGVTDSTGLALVGAAGLLLLGSGPTAVYVSRRRRTES